MGAKGVRGTCLRVSGLGSSGTHRAIGATQARLWQEFIVPDDASSMLGHCRRVLLHKVRDAQDKLLPLECS